MIKSKNLLTIFIIIISIIFIIEEIFFKSFTNKLIMLFIAIMIIVLFLKNKLDKKSCFFTMLLILYLIIFLINKINNNSIIEIAYIIFKFLEIIFFSYCILSLLNIPKEKKTKNKTLYLICCVFVIILVIQLIISKNIISIDILVFFLILLRILIIQNQKSIIKLLFDLITIIIGFFANSIILCLIIVALNIKELLELYKSKSKMLLHISLLIILVLISSLIIYNNVSEKREDKKTIVSNYEFPSNNMNDYKELKQILINRNLTERLFGSEKILSSNNTIIKNCSFIYSYIYLGLIGFILYLVFLIYTMKTVLQTYNKKFEAYILIMYSFMTSILLIPYTYLILSLVLTKNYNEKNTFNIQKVKVILTLCGIFIIGTTMLLYINYRTDYKTDKLIFYTSKQLKLEASKQYDLNLIESQKIEDLGIIENLYYYQLSNQNDILANIIYVTRDIDDITFKFFEIENKNNNLNINIKISDEQLICLKDFESYNIEREYDNTVGIDKLKLPIGYYKDNSKNYIISRTFKYNKLITEYDNNNKSTVYELISQEDDLKNNKKVVNIEPNTNVDIYIVESNKKLLKDEESIDEYIKLTNNNSSWYTFYGNNYKIQYSIEPFTREGYGKNLGRLIEEDAYKLSKNNNSILFSALSKNAIFSLYNHTAINTENNIWLTNYTSTWLSKDYDIKAYYIDTRFNETIGYLLLNLYYDTNNNKFLTSFINYADFIVESWQTESYLVSDNRILPDYFSDNHTLKTHSSFNHQLALINYLFKAYELTENKDYYKTAKEILNGILGFKDSWIRENKDIWYEVNSKGEFSGTDYEIVTLDDMLYTQKYLYQFDKELNEQLTKFIKSKLEYLKTKKVEIPSSTQELIDEYIKTE